MVQLWVQVLMISFSTMAAMAGRRMRAGGQRYLVQILTAAALFAMLQGSRAAAIPAVRMFARMFEPAALERISATFRKLTTTRKYDAPQDAQELDILMSLYDRYVCVYMNSCMHVCVSVYDSRTYTLSNTPMQRDRISIRSSSSNRQTITSTWNYTRVDSKFVRSTHKPAGFVCVCVCLCSVSFSLSLDPSILYLPMMTL